MSGEAAGILLLPLSLVALPFIGIALVGKAIAAGVAAVGEAVARHRERRRREEIRRNGVREAIGEFRSSMAVNMNEQIRLNAEVSDRMMKEMNKSREEMLRLVNEDDPEKYMQYMGHIQTARQELSAKLIHMQEEFVKNYHVKINENMNTLNNTINARYADYLQELEQFKADLNAKKEKAKKEKAKKIADDYIDESKILIEALENDYEAKKFANLQLIDLQKTLNEAISQYNLGNYEAAIAMAKNVAIAAIEEIYKADCKKQEWDNYYECALTIAYELEAYLQSQEKITADVKKQAEEKYGKSLEDEIVGINISEYTDKMKDGRNRFAYLLEEIRRIKHILESDSVNSLTTQQIKEYIKLLNDQLYPDAQLTVHKAVLNMSNAFTRQNISEEIIDFFEEHNFDFKGYKYEGDVHDGALHIGLENDITGEEIIVTLAPELMGNGDVQTRVEINQLQGDETDEDRKAFYRNSVQELVAGSTPGAQIRLECRKETKNKLSRKTELRDKLRK